MSHVVRKYFADFEKEEQWLNDMSAKGLALVEYSWARYVFEESAPGEYIYRLELLEEDPKKAKSAEYLQFMEETGAERVPAGKRPSGKTVNVNPRWVIFRKKQRRVPSPSIRIPIPKLSIIREYSGYGFRSRWRS